MTDKQDRRTVIKSLAAAGTAAALPAGLTACASSAKDAQVIVIGAGLSGLNAALLLQDQGFDVLVLEGSNRIGGRVYTLDDQPHRPDAGGSEFSLKSYARILDMIGRLDLEVIPWRGNGVNFAFHVNGQTVSVEDWPQAAVNNMQGPARNIPPAFLSGALLPRPSPLADLQAWLEPEAAQYDIAFRDFLTAQGVGPEVLRLIESRTESDSLDDVSTLWLMRAAKFAEVSGGIKELRNLKGGMSRLTDGMAALLNRPVAKGIHVAGIQQLNDGIEILDINGKIWRAEHVVCTIPLPVLRQMYIYPELPPLQASAVQQVPYGNHIEVFFDITEPFWEEDGLPSSLWTDGPLGMVMNRPGDAPTGYLWLAIAGQSSRELRQLPEAEILRRVTDELARVRPSTRGRVIPLTAHNWSAHPWTQGHTALRSPGQIGQFGDVLTQAHGRLHFAGEHTARLAGGMEGAMESGERAAMEIITRAL